MARDDLPDWRHADAYGRLRTLDRFGFAWEFLRRNAAYRASAGGQGEAVTWGLRFRR